MRKIYFIRHSIRDQAVSDDQTAPLTKAGHRMAENLVAKFQQKPITAIFTSPFLRAVQTVTPLAEQRAMSLVRVPALRERRTIKRSDWEAHLQILWTNFTWHEVGEESLSDVRDRMVPAYEQILLTTSGDIVIAGHGTALAVLFHVITHGRFTFKDWQAMSMPDCYVATYAHNTLVNFEHIGTE